MRRLRSDKGGIGVLFAVLLGSGALIALVGFAVDFGRAYLEQQELRNSSSAAALALAHACSKDEYVCSQPQLAANFVNEILEENASDGLVALDELCGTGVLNDCQPLSSRSMDCEGYAGSENLVRVTAKTLSTDGNFISLLFASVLGGGSAVELWHCAQAEWSVGGSQSDEFSTKFDLLLPACDFLANEAPVVWFRFENAGLTPVPSRETSCILETEEGPLALSDVMNGAARVDLATGKCDVSVAVNPVDGASFESSNWNQLCDNDEERFLKESIDTSATLKVGVGGTFVRTSNTNIQFELLGAANIRILGYRFSNSSQYGSVPPGGWDAYPPSAPANKRCAASRPCLYGFYVGQQEFLDSGIATARLIQ